MSPKIRSSMSEKKVKRFHKTIIFANLVVLVFISLLFYLGPFKMIRYRRILEFKKEKRVSSFHRKQEKTIATTKEDSDAPWRLLERAKSSLLCK